MGVVHTGTAGPTVRCASRESHGAPHVGDDRKPTECGAVVTFLQAAFAYFVSLRVREIVERALGVGSRSSHSNSECRNLVYFAKQNSLSSRQL